MDVGNKTSLNSLGRRTKMNASVVFDIMSRCGFNLNNLRGNDYKAARQRLMLALTGALLPGSKCGVSVLYAEFIRVFAIKSSEMCAASVYREVENKCRELAELEAKLVHK